MRAPALVRKIYAKFARPKDHWDHFLGSIARESLVWNPALDIAAKRALFKRNVTMVELEPHAFCNRTCAFCPNSTIDRLTVKSTFDRRLYTSILRDLQAIGYRQVLRFARYSEPMAHEHIYDMVALAREYLPKAEIDIVTNGDYLTPKALSRLRDGGLTVLRISVYMRRNVVWSVPAAREEISRLGTRIQIQPVWDDCTPTTVGAGFPYDGLRIVAFSHDFDRTGYDRGQLLGDLVDPKYVRRSPCFMVFSNFTVDFNGKVMPCCNLRSDHPDHAPFVLGDLSDGATSVFDVYANRLFTDWRRGLVTVGDKQDPCRTCKQKVVDGPALERLGGSVESRLRAAGLRL